MESLPGFGWLRDLQSVYRNPRQPDWMKSRALKSTPVVPATAPVSAVPSAVQAAPLGTHEFQALEIPVNLANTGITVTISDLHLPWEEQKVWNNGRWWYLPANTAAGKAVIQGTEAAENIEVSQNDDGNTLVRVRHNGETAALDLGRIAALTLEGYGGADDLRVNTSQFYGGIEVNAGEGDDHVKVAADYALRRGVTVQGDAGSDTLTLTGSALNMLVEGGAGNDHLQIESPSLWQDYSRRMQGDEGDDFLQGGIARDRLLGGAGNDYLRGKKGDDWLEGGAGNDRLLGQADADRLEGQAGLDVLMAGAGDDFLSGGADDDYLYAGDGEDQLRGDQGLDVFIPGAASPREIFLYERIGDALKVNRRGETRSQPVLAAYDVDTKLLLDYSPDDDALLDPRAVI